MFENSKLKWTPDSNEKLYRELKPPLAAELSSDIQAKLDPIYDPQQLDSVGAVYWKMYQQGLENDKFSSCKFFVDKRGRYSSRYY